MSQFTKKAIMDSFVKLLGEKTFDKITVKDIVDDCGVNRNTFYYYFEDIYALLSEIFRTETERVVTENQVFDSWHEGFIRSVQFAFENRRAIHNLYVSLNREVLEQYLYSVTGSLMYAFVSREAEGLEADSSDVKFIADFYKFALVGKILEWVGTDMKLDPVDDINRTAALFDGSIRAALERCSGAQKAQNSGE